MLRIQQQPIQNKNQAFFRYNKDPNEEFINFNEAFYVIQNRFDKNNNGLYEADEVADLLGKTPKEAEAFIQTIFKGSKKPLTTPDILTVVMAMDSANAENEMDFCHFR